MQADADEQEYSFFDLDLDTDMDAIPMTEGINPFHLYETTESSLVSMAPPVNHDTGGQALEHNEPCSTNPGLLSNSAGKEQKVAGHEANQDCGNCPAIE